MFDLLFVFQKITMFANQLFIFLMQIYNYNFSFPTIFIVLLQKKEKRGE